MTEQESTSYYGGLWMGGDAGCVWTPKPTTPAKKSRELVHQLKNELLNVVRATTCNVGRCEKISWVISRGGQEKGGKWRYVCPVVQARCLTPWPRKIFGAISFFLFLSMQRRVNIWEIELWLKLGVWARNVEKGLFDYSFFPTLLLREKRKLFN